MAILLNAPALIGLALASPAAQAQGAYQGYQYDTLGNLVGAVDSAGRNAQLRYDPADNRTSVEVTTGPIPPAPPAPPAPPQAAAFELILSPGTIVVVPRTP